MRAIGWMALAATVIFGGLGATPLSTALAAGDLIQQIKLTDKMIEGFIKMS